MKKFLCGVFMILVFSSLLAENTNVFTSSKKGLTFEMEIPDYRITSLELSGKRYEKIEIDGMGMMNEIGNPALPVKYIYVAVPLDAKNVSIYVEKQEKQEIKNVRILPAFLEQWNELNVFEDPSVYGKNTSFPGKDYEKLYDKVLFHQRIMKIAIYPFKYAPNIGRLTCYKRLKVHIDFIGEIKKEGGRRFLGKPTERRFNKLLVNYDNGKLWRESENNNKGMSLDYTPYYKVELTEDGMYKIDYNYLKDHNINPDDIDPRTLKIFNGGSAVLSFDTTSFPGENDTVPYQIPIYVYGESDGKFDMDDYLLFYGVSLSLWSRCSVSNNVPLFYNPYTDTNVYWLSWGESSGKRMDMVDGSPSFNEPFAPSSHQKTLHIEENKLCPAKSGFGWVWEEIVLPANVNSMSRDYVFSVENLYTDSFNISCAVYGATTSTHNVEIKMNDMQICDTSWSGVNFTSPFTWTCGGSNLVSGENKITLRLHESGGGDDIYVDYFEETHLENFKAKNNSIVFSAKETDPQDTTYEFNIFGFTESPFIFEVTDPFDVKKINGADYNSGGVQFQIYVPQGGGKRFVAAGVFKTPLDMKEGNPYSLRMQDKADYIIITHKKFYYAASLLKNWRQTHLLGVQNPAVKLVLIDEIFDNFGWGLKDPVAIRNFLYYASKYWQVPPAYVLLFGAGSYDYKNLFNNPVPKNYIPVHETGDYVHFQALMNNNPCYEDWFTDFTGDLLADIPIGRVTVITQEEAADVVEKIKRFESDNLGNWRNKVILLADDEFDDKGIDGLYVFHVAGTEEIDGLIPYTFDREKIYLTEYPGSNPGSIPPGTKPQARAALIDAINKGGLFGTYLGHGNFEQLAHELVFYSPSDVGILENDYREPFFYFGSCSVGDFDRVEKESIADLLQKKDRRGAIATLACARTSGYPSITALGKELAVNILGDHNSTIGDGVLLSKKHTSFGKTYAFFGDPATPIYPDSIGFQATINSETLTGGMKTEIYIKTTDPAFVGFLYLSAFGTIKKIAHPVPQTSYTMHYNLPGNSLFQGIYNITTEEVDTVSFFVPTGLDSGNTSRISMYIWNNSKEGRGSFDSLITNSIYDTSTDIIPPSIAIYYRGKLLQNGSTIPNNAEITGVLEDGSGIDMTGRDSTKSIYLAINEDYAHKKILDDYFFYDINSSTKGSFSHSLALDTTASTVELRFSCYDNCKNHATKILNLNVISGEKFTLTNVYNFPNPFKKKTYFTFNLSHRSSVALSVYTVSGKMVYKRAVTCESGFNKLLWDGRDLDGDKIANGIYFFKISAKPTEEMSYYNNYREVEYTGKIAIAR